ncbi:hypothetical protein [Nocardioides aurantiacus]|uniref:Uncharacterized protein n=1 Tax=Nocardioides aurantiacus TaxID=86796 RepID=A0A3N2CW80_9ACTN|nr:hypothetical protein [Nocardioides aurantiacus]ROR91743.1 hypothetical protein EDD33_2618 [Nocardioides aurantiacus]
MSEQVARAVDEVLAPKTCAMDDPAVNMCPHDACWLGITCAVPNVTTEGAGA